MYYLFSNFSLSLSSTCKLGKRSPSLAAFHELTAQEAGVASGSSHLKHVWGRGIQNASERLRIRLEAPPHPEEWGGRDPTAGMSRGSPTRWFSVPPPSTRSGNLEGLPTLPNFQVVSEAACAPASNACLQRGRVWDALLPPGSPRLLHSLPRPSRVPGPPAPGFSSPCARGEPAPPRASPATTLHREEPRRS